MVAIGRIGNGIAPGHAIRIVKLDVIVFNNQNVRSRTNCLTLRPHVAIRVRSDPAYQPCCTALLCLVPANLSLPVRRSSATIHYIHLHGYGGFCTGSISPETSRAAPSLGYMRTCG